ncbi:MAG: serine hydrolase domain-containing protein [Bacteroidota bacterium]
MRPNQQPLSGPCAVIAILLISSLTIWAQPVIDLSASDEALLDSLCQVHVAEGQLPGFAVGIVSKGKVLYAKGFGVKNLDTKDPVTTSSIFHLASISKTFVGTGIAQLVEKGKIDLDDPVTKYLPYFQLKDPRYKDITIRHLVTHSAGVPDVMNYHWNKPKYDDEALEGQVRSLKSKGLNFEPGTDFKYSNNGFEVLGDVIAKASGMSFEDYMKTQIMTPIGMSNSTFFKPDVPQELATSPHIKRAKMKVSDVYPYNREHAPSSTLNANIDEMVKYALAYLNKGSYDGKAIFSEATYELLTTRQREFDEVRGIGVSWFVGPASWRGDDGIRIQHSGGDRGYRSWIGILPEKSWAMITLYNCDWKIPPTDAIFDTAYEMAERYD